ncbi:MAG: transcriptional regulator [Pseudomonadota bacterium]|nr:transcriptional regulator [Pseudomonadota bacterium]|tara:strand:- start:72 stop:371 length:300 start_codon:yes stop_codon:yes gene_type:complete
MAKRDLHKVLFPRQKKVLSVFGEDLLLALKRRGFSKKILSERTGFDAKTIKKIFEGDPGVAIGAYIKVLGVLGLLDNFAEIAAKDEVGIQLQNAKLLGG